MGLDRKSTEASHIWYDMWCWETPFVNKQGVTKLTFTRNIKGATFECTSYRSVFLITWPKYEKFLLSPHSKMLIHFIQCISSLHFRFAHSYNYKLYVNSNPTSMQSDLFHNGLYLDIASHYIQRILNRFSTYVFYTVYILCWNSWFALYFNGKMWVNSNQASEFQSWNILLCLALHMLQTFVIYLFLTF